jgi:hypothetical protein
MIDPMDFLLLVKGPLFVWALAIFALGLSVRILEILVLGRARNFAEPRAGEWLPGLRTMLTRSVADPGTFQRAPFDVVVGWIWHIGFLIALTPVHPAHRADQESAWRLLAGTAQSDRRSRHRRDPGGAVSDPGASADPSGEARISTFEDYLVWA